MTAMQLPLDLGHQPALRRDAFWVSPSNEAAIGWIDFWPAWPAPAVILEGPPGSGKTHLAGVWRLRSDAGEIAGADLDIVAAGRLPEAHRALVVEEAEAAPERALLHLYNAMAERHGHLLLTASRPPQQWQVQLADLRSRLLALPVASIRPPDDALLRAVLSKLFADRQLAVPEEVVDFLLPRMERSFEAAGRLAGLIDAASLAARRPVTLPLARRVLALFEPEA